VDRLKRKFTTLLLQISRLDAFATIRPAASVMGVSGGQNFIHLAGQVASCSLRLNASDRRLFRPTLLADERFQAPFKHR
jgi:hypothetical protein